MKKPDRKKKKGGGIFATILLLAVFLVGVGVLLYPTFSDWWNSRVQSRAVAGYLSAADSISEADYSGYLEAARLYNKKLKELGSAAAFVSPELVDGDYWSLLDVTGNGIMGVITIDKIDVRLPIYHGTDEAVLQIAAGHMEGSSLPVGGEGTHSVISAHTGLPSSLLFTHLDRMEEGDTFTVTVLKEVLTYQIDRILVVLPTEVENLYIEDGKDYCTLMTCTPYGINSHRLLVRGERIYPEEVRESTGAVTGETETRGWAMPSWAKWAALGAGVLLLIYLVSDILVRIIRRMRKSKKERRDSDKGSD